MKRIPIKNIWHDWYGCLVDDIPELIKNIGEVKNLKKHN